MPEDNSHSTSSDSPMKPTHPSSCGKTLLGAYLAGEVRIFVSLCEYSQVPQNLSEQIQNLENTGWYVDLDELSRGESWTLNTSEYPNDVVESTLSQVVEPSVPQKYFLSERACLGILSRVDRKPKEPPQELTDALLNGVMSTI